MPLQGGPALRARLAALRTAFKPTGRRWAEDTIDLARPHIPRRTGRGVASLKVKNASQRKASVGGMWYLHILDAGAKAHDIEPRKASVLRFEAGGLPVFARKVHQPRQQGLGFMAGPAKEALARNPAAEEIIRAWNEAR